MARLGSMCAETEQNRWRAHVEVALPPLSHKWLGQVLCEHKSTSFRMQIDLSYGTHT